MHEPGQATDETPSLSQRVGQICARFEGVWMANSELQLEDFLTELPREI